jgi:hypothetical protein
MERPLSAILMADVLGYSHLRAVGEAGTLAVPKAWHKDFLEPIAAGYLREEFISVLEGMMLRLSTRQDGPVLVGAGVGIVVDHLGSPWWKTALIATFVASSLIAVIRGGQMTR